MYNLKYGGLIHALPWHQSPEAFVTACGSLAINADHKSHAKTSCGCSSAPKRYSPAEPHGKARDKDLTAEYVTCLQCLCKVGAGR
jgi:hypothetical protein